MDDARAIPVIAVSDTVEDEPLPAGVTAFMLKPLDFDRLVALVSEHCATPTEK